MGAAPARIMGQGLTVKPRQIDSFESRHHLRVDSLDHLGSVRDIFVLPFAQSRPQHVTLPVGVRAISTVTKFKNSMPVTHYNCRIDPVQGRSRHGTKGTERTRLLHCAFPLHTTGI